MLDVLNREGILVSTRMCQVVWRSRMAPKDWQTELVIPWPAARF